MKQAQGILLPVLAVVGLNLLAHFLPFERAAWSGDDFQYLAVSSWQARWDLVRDHLTTALRRPLEVSHQVLHWGIGENQLLWVAPLFLAASLFAVSVYFVMRELLGDPRLSLACAMLYVLLPNKAQLYSYVAYTHINAVYTFTAASLAFFLAYLRTSRRTWLWASLACYTLTLFWYELGFFLPLVLAATAALYGKKKMGACLFFLLPILLNVLWRAGVLLGQDFLLKPEWVGGTALWPKFIDGAGSLYFGRQMLKFLLYGLGRFPSMDLPWLAALTAADALVLGGMYRWLRKKPLPPVPGRALGVAAAAWIFLMIPAAMGHGILDRHTGLSSIGFAVFLAAAARFATGSRPVLLAAFLTLLSGVGLVVCQTTAWNQVVSCRINHAVLETLREKRQALGSLRRTGLVLIDQYSFSEKIPYTWVKDPHNHLDTYWGVGGMAGEGYGGYVSWVAGKRKRVEIVRSPIRAEGSALTFEAYNPGTYQFDRRSVPRKGTLLIDYAAVYPRGFHQGKR